MSFRKEVLAEGVEVYCGDCREVLPTAPIFDLCLADPPYGIRADEAIGPASSGWTQFEVNKWDRERPSKDLFELIISRSKVQIIWGGNYFTDHLPPSMQWLVWDKGQRDFSLADCEFAWTSQNKAARVFTYPRALALRDGKEHPTQKPVALMSWCLEQVPKTRTVCDPFLGSGTSGVACVRAGLSFTGIERHEPYFDIACRRIEAALKQPDMFVEAPQPMVQTSLLDPAA